MASRPKPSRVLPIVVLLVQACHAQVAQVTPTPQGRGLSDFANSAAAAAMAPAVPDPVTGVVPTVPAAPGAQDICEAAIVKDPLPYLRQLSFDLRGRPPTIDEMDQALAAGDVPKTLVESMLHDAGFLEQVRVWHRAKLLPNIDGFRVSAGGLLAFDPAADVPPGPTPLSDFRYEGRFRPGGSYDDLVNPEASVVGPTPVNPSWVLVFNGSDPMARWRGSNYPDPVRCDGNLEYPDPDALPRPSYTGGDGATHYYYDTYKVPLPYYDWMHCPNYCIKNGVNLSNANTDGDFMHMRDPTPDSSPHPLDRPGYRCQSGYTKVINDCQRATTQVASSNIEGHLRYRIEGYRKVPHYWSRGVAIKTCAYEAQQNALRKGGDCLANDGSGNRQAYDTACWSNADCDSSHHCVLQTTKTCADAIGYDPSCGCGPNGDYCTPNQPGFQSEVPSYSERRLRTALNEEPTEIIKGVVDAEQDYFEIFRTKTSYLTGVLSYVYKHQLDALHGAGGFAFSAPAPQASLPDLPYDDDTWHAYTRGPEAAGILTTPAYLLRFPTWRSRVNEFRSQFMCRPFVPVAKLPSPSDVCNTEQSLAKRCGCQGCHAAIEPLGTFFGRWAERSPQYLDKTNFPDYVAKCAGSAPDATGWGPRDPRCGQMYYARNNYDKPAIPAEALPWLGQLNTYVYRSDEERARVDVGPSGLAQLAIDSGELADCTVRSAFKTLVGREMSDDENSAVLPDLVARFEASGHNYRDLVRAIVTSAYYRKVN